MNNPQNQNTIPTNNTIQPHFNPYIHGMHNFQSPHTQQPVSPNPQAGKIRSLFNSGSTQKDLLKGMLLGAAATFILTNEDAQKAIFKNFAKISSLLEMGIEELKERYEDAKAEVKE